MSKNDFSIELVRQSYQDIKAILEEAGLLDYLKYAIRYDSDNLLSTWEYVPPTIREKVTYKATINGIEQQPLDWFFCISSLTCRIYRIDYLAKVEDELEVKISNSKGDSYHFIGKVMAHKESQGNTNSYYLQVLRNVEE